MDGIEAARILANGARTAAIPVVALSAVAFEGDTAWLTRAGFGGYLEKPIDIENFPHQVRRFCA
jgi:two-component system cell cycle response regulator DivK